MAGALLATCLTACARPPADDGIGPTNSPSSPGPLGTIPPVAPSSAPDLTGATPRVLDVELLGDLDRYVQDAMRRYGVPGVEIAVVQNGAIVHLASFGVREPGKPDPVTTDTRMKIGSTTKSMTTMMMGTLVDDGSMTWDTRAVDVLPWFQTGDPTRTAQITVRDLVSNATGLERRDAEMIFNAGRLDAESMVRSISTFAFDPQATFRKTFGYSNQMVAAGGYIAAQTAPGATDDLYANYVAQIQHRVFDPIGMTHTTFSLQDVRTSGNFASPTAHNLDFSPAVVPEPIEEMFRPFAPAGMAWSTAGDMARYLVTELGRGVGPDGRRVVSEANLVKTWTPQVEVGPGRSYGLGWFVTSYKGITRIGHGGDTAGYSSAVDFLPDAGIGVVVLDNLGGASIFGTAVASRLYELAYDQPAESDDAVAAAFAHLRGAFLGAFSHVQPGIDAEELDGFLGSYHNDALGDLELAVRDDKAVIDTGIFASTLGRLGGGTYIALNMPIPAATFTFGRGADGKQTLTFATNNPDEPGTWTFVRK
jgi:CubicO group peptidase (beta-lactamase class C family)